MSTPHFQAIEGGNRPIGAIDAPDINLHPSDPSSATQPAGSLAGSRHSHAARVVGSFDHSILPEPPVCFSRNSSAIELTSLPLNEPEKDNDTRYGFFIMLCYRRERSERKWRAHCHIANQRGCRGDTCSVEIYHRGSRVYSLMSMLNAFFFHSSLAMTRKNQLRPSC